MVGDKSGEAGGGQMMNGAVSHANQPRIYSSSSELCRGRDVRWQAGENTGQQLKIMEPLGKP